MLFRRKGAQQVYNDGPVASADRVRREVENLSPDDLAWLRWYSSLKSFQHGTHDDLLQDSMLAILDGRRPWKPDSVKFVPFLCGVISSVAYNRNRKLLSESRQFFPLPERNHEVSLPLERRLTDADLVAAQRLEHLYFRLRGDHEAIRFLELIDGEGLMFSEAAQRLDLTQHQREAVVKRLRRAVTRYLEE